VFAHIDSTGTRLTTLASRANITPQAMGQLVDDLEVMGYVGREPDPTDRRAKLVTLTPLGVACINAGLETVGGIEHDLEELLGPRSLANLRAALRKIVNASGTAQLAE
jgi:DNA-binding MarR family transcriptional regulator